MATTDSTEALDVIVVGVGQAGRAVAYQLTRQGSRLRRLRRKGVEVRPRVVSITAGA